MTRRRPSLEDHAIFAAPWQHGELPVSVRSGRGVSMDVAERDYLESYGPIDSPGLWDHDAGPAPHPGRARRREPRYDDEAMRRHVERHGTELTVRDWEVYTLFWRDLLSYAEIARSLDVARDRVRETVQRLRRRLL